MAGSDTLEDALRRLEASVFDGEFTVSLERLSRALGFEHFSLVETDFRSFTSIATGGVQECLNAYASGGWFEDDLRYEYVQKAPPGQLFVDSLAIPEALKRRSPVYNEFFPRHGVDHFAGWTVMTGNRSWFAAVTRPARIGPVLPEEARRIAGVMERANSVFRTRHALQAAREQGLLEGIETSPEAIVGLAGDGRVAIANRSARRIFGPSFGIREGRLWSVSREGQSRLERLEAAAAGMTDPGKIVVRTEHGRLPVILTPSPVRPPGMDMLRGVRLLLIISDLNDRPSPALVALRDIFRLSPAEAEIAASLAAGLQPAEIADLRKVAKDTVRGQIKSLMQKMNVHRHSEIARIVERLGRASAGGAPDPQEPGGKDAGAPAS